MRAYATVDEFETHLDGDPLPPHAGRLLAAASLRVDAAIRGFVYETDDDGMPTDADVARVLMEATCLQAQYQADSGDETGAGQGFASVTVGGVSYSRSTSRTRNGSGSTPGVSRTAPDMLDLLRVEGILPIKARSGRGSST